MDNSSRLEIGKIINTHGVRGEVKLEPWADSPEALLSLKALWLDGSAIPLERSRVHGRFLILKLQGIDTVEAAMALKGKVALAERSELPFPRGAGSSRVFWAFRCGRRRTAAWWGPSRTCWITPPGGSSSSPGRKNT